MQATDTFSVSRRAMDLEDLIDIARRHKSWIFAPLFGGIVVATVVAFLWPDTYVSMALLRVTSSQVPERFVASNVNQVLTERINAIAQGVMSRSTLTNIIQTYDLYPRERRRLPIEDVIQRMQQKDIKIGMVSSQQGQARVGAFPISFQYENRYLAQKVTQDLVSRMVNENERETILSSQQTTDLMTSEVQKAKIRLDEIEAKLADFRVKNAGRLPDDRQMNLATMNSLDQRLTQLSGALSRGNGDKLMLESSLRVQREQLAKAIEANTVIGDPAKAVARNDQLIQKEKEVQALEQKLIQLREMYTETHPDVRGLQLNLALARRQREELATADETARKAAQTENSKAQKRVVMTKEMVAVESGIKQLESLINAKTIELQDLAKQQERVTEQLKAYESRITTSPLADQMYVQLARDYEQAKVTYNTLAVKQEDSQRATTVIRNKQGETLELLDQASLPAKPSQPDRPLIIGAGALIGLILGAVLTGIREMKDTTLKNLKDVRAYTQLTVLGSVPLLEDDVVVKRRKRLGLLGWATAVLVGVIVMGSAMAFYYATNT